MKEEYDRIAGEDNEVFNSSIERKMQFAKGQSDEQPAPILESKYARSELKYVCIRGTS